MITARRLYMPNDEDDLREIDIKNTDFSSGAEETFINEETNSAQDEEAKEEMLSESLDINAEESAHQLKKNEENFPTHSEASLKKASISDLSVRVQVEVSRFDVSLDELMKMEPGYRLPVEINPSHVNLTVNGKLIGRGEIVEIGNQVGVRITELYK